MIHLWMYDKFQCLKWGSGRQPGAFKRVMTCVNHLVDSCLLANYGVSCSFQQLLLPSHSAIVDGILGRNGYTLVSGGCD